MAPALCVWRRPKAKVPRRSLGSAGSQSQPGLRPPAKIGYKICSRSDVGGLSRNNGQVQAETL